MDTYDFIDDDRRPIVVGICAWLCQLSEGMAGRQSGITPYKIVNFAQTITTERKLVRLCPHAVFAAKDIRDKHLIYHLQ